MPVCVIIQLSSPEQPFSLPRGAYCDWPTEINGSHLHCEAGGVGVDAGAAIGGRVPLSALAARVSAVSVAHGGAPTTAWHRHQIPLALGNGIWFLFRMRAKIIWNRLDFRVHPFFPVKVCQFRHHLPQR